MLQRSTSSSWVNPLAFLSSRILWPSSGCFIIMRFGLTMASCDFSKRNRPKSERIKPDIYPTIGEFIHLEVILLYLKVTYIFSKEVVLILYPTLRLIN